MPIARLDDRALITVTGKDAKAFLQGLISNDVEKAAGGAIYAALLAPQGKIMFDFFVVARGEGYVLDANAAQADELLKRLRTYKLRAAVDLAPLVELAAFAIWDAEPAPNTESVFADPRLAAMGWRAIAAMDEITVDASAGDYDAHRLSLGVPDSSDVVGEFLLDANGEELSAVDFKKGCFVGQEVTARMKHKAHPRRRLVLLGFENGVPAPGSILTGANGTDLGEIKSGAGGRAMASVRIDRLAGAGALSAGVTAARLMPTAYALPMPPAAV